MGVPKNSIRLRLNSRSLLEETLRAGVLAKAPEAFAPLCVIIDKIDKIGKDAVIEQLSAPEGPVNISRESSEQTVELLSVTTLDEASRNAPPNSSAIESLKKLFSLLDAYDIVDQVDFDASVVRGLAYYTGIVFEAFDTSGKLRAVCGGGRYDKLLETLGGPSIPAVGFGFGDAVISELLKEHKLLPETPRKIDALVLALGEQEQQSATKLANRLRVEGHAVELALAPMRVKKALQDADRAGAATLYVIGPEEQARGVARARSLGTREEWEVKL
jgi:histidyl-tRNA synthetase